MLHAHDYGPVEFMRRYFDEYRGLRETIGHVEPFSARGLAGHGAAAGGGRPRAGCASGAGTPAGARAGPLRSAAHHAGRRRRSRRSARARSGCPGRLQRAFSLERRAERTGAARRTRVAATMRRPLWWRRGRAEPATGRRRWRSRLPGTSERDRLHIAVVIPPFARGSGGHNSIFQMMLRFERMGHTCSIWVYDPLGLHAHERPAVLRRRVVEEFAPLAAPVFKGFDDWYGADVVVATGWETAYPVMLPAAAAARGPT